MKLALIREVFHGASGKAELDECLASAASRGATLALLPELPLNAWSPASTEQRSEDAEEDEGPRSRLLAAAAKQHAIGIIGGIIWRNSAGRRKNMALVFDSQGTRRGQYCKVHLPEEEGFWETSHYQPGESAPRVYAHEAIPFGIQICSDINRPVGSQFLAAQGAGLILAPRATEAATYLRWKLVYRATALTSSCFVASVNRPGPEYSVELGGPSLVVGPDGEILLETEKKVALVDLDPAQVTRARKRYPGYLDWPARDYADWWSER